MRCRAGGVGRLGHTGRRAIASTRLVHGLHVGFRARDRAQVDAFWQAGIDAGYADDGVPGPRTQYGPTYYGAFLLDPDGNSVEAVHSDREHPAVPDGRVDHLWDPRPYWRASRRFYTTIAPHAGLPAYSHRRAGRPRPPARTTAPRSSGTLSGRPRSASHSRSPRTTTRRAGAFHAAALAAGYEDHGAPGDGAV